MVAACARNVVAASLLSLAVGGSEPLDLLERISDAFESQTGLYVSVAVGRELMSADVSASLLRYDVPLALYRNADTLRFQQEVTISDDRGIIYEPASPPVVLCAYPTDAVTYDRTNSLGEQDPCSPSPNISGSGRCTMPASEYVENYYFTNKSAQVWELFHSCHFDYADEALEAQKALWQNLTNTALLKYVSQTNIRPYNEVILENDHPPVAFFWAHSGEFRDPSNDDTMACCLKKEYDCSNTSATGNKPLFEFANTYINWAVTAKWLPPNYGKMQSYKKAMQRLPPGWTANEFIREMDVLTLCALNCSAQEIVCSA